MKIAVLAGDGIGPEVTAEAVRVLEALGLPDLELTHADIGGVAYRNHGHPLPPETLETARAADAILFGAVGDPACDTLERHLRPEQAILGLRKELQLFANLRPAKVFPGLEYLSPLKHEVASDLDLLIVNLNDRPRLLRNDGGNRNPWLMVDARAPNGRSPAIGSRVTVTAGGVRQIRDLIPTGGYLSQGDPRLHYGLGRHQRAERVEIRWPDGPTTVLNDVPSRQFLTTVQPGMK